MQTKLNPYLHFRDNARDAIQFYTSVFGGKLTINTFKEFPAAHDPSDDDKVMHAQLDADNGITLMASDTPSSMSYQPGDNKISVSLSGDNEAELQGYYAKLSSGGQITVPLEKAQWGDSFGMCTDKFGIEWLVNISAPKQ